MRTDDLPPRTDNLQAYLEILSLVEQSMAEYNTIADDVRGRQDRIAQERAALGAQRNRLVDMRKALKEWESQVWDMWIRDVGPREARLTAKQRLREYEILLDALIWQLFDFRVESRPP